MPNNDLGSLNFGNELEDDNTSVVIPTDPVEETLDLVVEESIIVALESQLNDLRYLADDIARAGGMKQSFALEAANILPGFGGVPVGFYSKDPSATRYKVSLEEITKGMWAAIAAVSAAVLAMLYKIIKWFRGDRSDGKGKGIDAVIDAKVDAVKANQEAATDAAGLVKETTSVLHTLVLKDEAGKEFKVSNFQDAIDKMPNRKIYETVMKHLISTNDIFVQYATHGVYYKAIMEAGKQLAAKAALINTKIKGMAAVSYSAAGTENNSDHGDADVEILNDSRLRVLGAPVTISIAGHDYALDEAFHHLQDLKRTEMPNNGNSINISFDTIFASLATAFKNNDIISTLNVIRTANKTIEATSIPMEVVVEKQGSVVTDGMPGGQSTSQGTEIRAINNTIRKELASLASISGMVTQFIDSGDKVLISMLDGGIAIINSISKYIPDDKRPEKWDSVVNEWKKIVKNAKDANYSR